ncbi:MAG: type II secretion system protein [Candidatus Gracilibacteria bacterium]|nr:type II secretion system protein [Candidatus Gracilibacteria bacterium]
MNKQKYKSITKKGFTLVELIVTITIVAILSTIGFNSYVGYLGEARDSERKANMGEIKTALKLYKQKRGAYPTPGNVFSILNNTKIVAFQGILNEDVTLNTMDNIPKDPYTSKYYFFSISKNKQEAEVALTLENGDFPIALLDGDYKTVSINVLPSLILATGSTSSVEIHTGVGDGTANRNLFILNGGKNLPYSIAKPNDIVYAGEILDSVISGGNIKLWQNSDFRTCDEISEAGKLIHDTGTEQYQILDNTGYLTNTGCVLP